MSNSNKFEKHTLRKHIKPLIDIDEDEDDRRRDSSGRKRVDVIQCLLESSSSDDNETEHTTKQNSNEIVWLTFAEICHIRTVLAQTSDSNRTLNKDTQQSRIFQNERCFRCQKPMNFLFLPLSLYSNDTSICCVCQEKVCKNCSMTNFLSPSLKHCFPVRTKTILNSSSTPVEYPINPMHESIPNSKTICFACSQVTFICLKHSFIDKLY